MERSSAEAPRTALVAGSAIIVLLTFLWVAAFSVLVPDRDLLASWALLAETGEAARIGVVAAVTAGIAAALTLVGWLWIGRRPRIAPWIRRWAIAVFMLSTVFLVVTTYLPWTARVAARNGDLASAGAFASFVPHALVLTAWVLSGVTIVVFALIAVVAEDRRRRDE